MALVPAPRFGRATLDGLPITLGEPPPLPRVQIPAISPRRVRKECNRSRLAPLCAPARPQGTDRTTGSRRTSAFRIQVENCHSVEPATESPYGLCRRYGAASWASSTVTRVQRRDAASPRAFNVYYPLLALGSSERLLSRSWDRVSRSLIDLLELVRVCEKHDVALVSASESIDTFTPAIAGRVRGVRARSHLGTHLRRTRR